MSILQKVRQLTRAAKVRYATLLVAMLLFLPPFSIIPQFFGTTRFCGTWCPRMFLSLKPTSYILSATFMGVALVALILAITFFVGRMWCGRVCPIGGVSELGAKLVPEKVKIDYSRIPAPSVRYGYFLVFLLAPGLGIGGLCCNLCNFSVVPHTLTAPMDAAGRAFLLTTTGGISLALFVVLGIWAKGGRGYCNFMCPVGALDSLANALGAKLGFRRMKVDTSTCNGCGKCQPVCPTWAVTRAASATAISQFSCISCGKCKDVCPRGAIHHG